jgi:hypothetical protein
LDPRRFSELAGNLLDRNRLGKPSDNYATILRGFGLDKAGVPFKKLIRDQLHGQPLSSRAVITKRAHPSRCLGLPRKPWAGSTEGAVSFTHREQFRLRLRLRTRSSSG